MQKNFRAAALAALLCTSVLPAFAADRTFNPDLSLILQGLYQRADARSGEGPSGFWSAPEPHGDEAEAPRNRGFQLGESELVLSANVDQHFKGLLTLAFGDEHGTEIEEAYLQTLALGNGLTVRGGRFLSGIGYSNEQHPHVWDFADATLMQRALFGEHGYGQDGVQVRWLAPTETFLEFGFESGRGERFPGSERNKSGSGAGAVFAHVGGDVGEAHSWRAGVSWLATRASERDADVSDVAGEEVETPFSGKSRTAIVDFVWKWAIAPGRSFKLQAEGFRRTESGDVSCIDPAGAGGASACATEVMDTYRSAQRGGYAQGIYQFAREWRAGVRYDRLDSGRVDLGPALAAVLPAPVDYAPRRVTLMTDWSPSEFSRLRLQFARDKSQQGLTDHQMTLQYIVSLGAHGAHRY